MSPSAISGPLMSELSVDERKKRIAVICSSNMNRSMEAHRLLEKKGYNISSYGTGNRVKLPGTSHDNPNVYAFQTPYNEIYEDLYRKDRNVYRQNGMLNMLDRNRKIKRHPEKFQDNKDVFNIILSCEERVYDQILTDFNERKAKSFTQCHVINLDIPDNHEDADIGAIVFSQLLDELIKDNDLDANIDELLQSFEEEKKRDLMHSVVFY